MNRRLALIEAGRYALAHAQPDGSRLLLRVHELERIAAAQAERIRELEAHGAEPLLQVNESRKAEGARLDGAIEAALVADPESDAWTAKEVGKALERAGFDPLPARRTIADHLKAFRNRGGTLSRHRND